VAAAPAKGVEFVAELSAEGWKDIYSKTISKLPLK